MWQLLPVLLANTTRRSPDPYYCSKLDAISTLWRKCRLQCKATLQTRCPSTSEQASKRPSEVKLLLSDTFVLAYTQIVPTRSLPGVAHPCVLLTVLVVAVRTTLRILVVKKTRAAAARLEEKKAEQEAAAAAQQLAPAAEGDGAAARVPWAQQVPYGLGGYAPPGAGRWEASGAGASSARHDPV
jgi:hypothetical protein